MLVVSFFQWWYGRGFSEYLASFVDGLRDAADFFSIRLLVRNLFAPFRQISAEKQINLPLNARIHAWFDLLISRLVGATVRFMILIAGTVVMILRAGPAPRWAPRSRAPWPGRAHGRGPARG